jgi:hypothetical protein
MITAGTVEFERVMGEVEVMRNGSFLAFSFRMPDIEERLDFMLLAADVAAVIALAHGESDEVRIETDVRAEVACALLAENAAPKRDGRDPDRDERFVLIQAKSVLALEEQLKHLQQPDVIDRSVTCKLCHGTGTGHGFDAMKPCPACNGAGRVLVR